jgi:hypothetical protein
MASRKRDATKQRLGTFRPARGTRGPARKPRPVIPADLIGPPAVPTTEPVDVQREFAALTEAAHAQGTASKADAAVYLLTARALAAATRYARLLAAEGETYALPSGIRYARPEVALCADAWRRALTGLKVLGLAPTVRGSVEPLIPPGPTDALEQLLAQQERAAP